MGGEAEREQHGHGREQAEAVPVADRRRQAAAGRRVGKREPLWREPRHEAVEAGRGRPGPDAPDEAAVGARADDADDGDRREHVDERLLGREHGLGGARRPERRETGPADEGGKEAGEGELEPGDAAGAEHEPDQAEPGEDERCPSPGRRPVATLVGGQDAGDEPADEERRGAAQPLPRATADGASATEASPAISRPRPRSRGSAR